ncbi:MAG: CpsD/CapB family tyrosine-protein kinase [Planctomycetes bacterium]|nr:CpsD/CapB family tyrosine-protein kinase [Planctomycetota bacterium]
MSVDDAFRKLMQDGGLGPAPFASPAAAPAAPQPVRVEAPVAESDNASLAPTKVKVKPIDLNRITTVERFAHHPIDSRSQIAEEYRILRTRLQSMELEKNSILLTSCHHNEGKSNTALNLALSFSKRNKKKILLVDFDLRRPRLHRMLGLPKVDYDVVSALRGKCEPEDAIIFSREDNLYVLAAKREYANGTDYLESSKARELIERLHASFDFVVMDSCPCLSTSDPAILGPLVGGVIMVIRCLKTQRESITHAINSMNEVGVEVIGVILTFMKYFLPNYLYRYQYYHGQYYAKGYGYGYGMADVHEEDNGDEHDTPPPEEDYGGDDMSDDERPIV